MRYTLTAVALVGLLIGCNGQDGPQTTEIDPPTRTLDQLSPEHDGPADMHQRDRDGMPPPATFEAESPDNDLPAGVVPGEQSYVVEEGDTLWSIAERLLGDGQRWRDIVEMNPGLVPEELHAGQTLSLPEE